MSEAVKVPGRVDAERAAALLVSEGAGKVLLFGSVARGEASEESDIDLVAIYDDLDYEERFARKRELSKLARETIGYPVDVLVTDRPEWKIRTQEVVTSLESRIADYGVVLADRGAGHHVEWDKEMVLPTNGREAALRCLREVSSALRTLEMFLKPSDDESSARRSGDTEEAVYLEVVRFEGACGQVQRAVESAIKALVHLAGRRRELRGHNIGELAAQLVEPYRRDVDGLMAGADAAEMTRWQQDSRYVTTDPDYESPTADLVRVLIGAASGVASYVAEQLGGGSREVRRVRRAVKVIDHRLRAYDLETGEPVP